MAEMFRLATSLVCRKSAPATGLIVTTPRRERESYFKAISSGMSEDASPWYTNVRPPFSVVYAAHALIASRRTPGFRPAKSSLSSWRIRGFTSPSTLNAFRCSCWILTRQTVRPDPSDAFSTLYGAPSGFRSTGISLTISRTTSRTTGCGWPWTAFGFSLPCNHTFVRTVRVSIIAKACFASSFSSLSGERDREEKRGRCGGREEMEISASRNVAAAS